MVFHIGLIIYKIIQMLNYVIIEMVLNTCRMGNLVYVRNQFLTSCYGLVVRMGSSLVPDWKG